MDWSKGYSATYYAKRVDPATWQDLDTIQLTGGQIKREKTGLRQSADLDCVRYNVGIEQWVRVYLDTRQEGGRASHEAVFTGLATSPESEHDGNYETNALECYSVLKAADDIDLLRGWYVPAGTIGGNAIRKLLAAIPAPVDIEPGSPRLETAIVAEDGETNLTMVDKILTAMGWELRIDGYGNVRIQPPPTQPVQTYDPLEYDMIETEISVSGDLFSAPNVYVAISGDMTAIVRDESAKSPLSIPNRGREVWHTEKDCKLADNQNIAQYAKDALLTAQMIQRTADYDRRYDPIVFPGDLIRLHYPAQRLDGVYAVDTQSIELGYNARTSESVSKYVTADELLERNVQIGEFVIVDAEKAYMVTDDVDKVTALGEV